MKSNDLFKRTQFQLTLLYSGFLMIFLVLFIIIVYTLVYSVMLYGHKQEAKSLAREEARMVTNFLVRDRMGHGFRNPNIIAAREDQFFYYVVNQKNELLLGNEVIPELRGILVGLINQTAEKQSEFIFDSVELAASSEARIIDLIITSSPIVYNGQMLGTIYIGKDISFFYKLLRSLLLILIAISIIFLGVAFVISHIMSKRAMIPITEAFTRQREFVADASHELRTPLSVLLSSIDAIEMTNAIEPKSYPSKLLHSMKDEVKRMTNLVGDLLSLARSDSMAQELVKETIDFRDPAERTIQSLQAIADSKQITLHFDAPASIIIKGDLERLKQLLYILLDNAIKYTPNGGNVTLTIAFVNCEKKQELMIEVQDSGIGIGQAEQQKIFERFYRVEKARTRQLGGHGLGLSIAKWIVDSHSGTIQVVSELDKGSTFIVRIPVSN